ncbi:MAG: hypothetical protein RSE13_01480 [Planktothrix sp. GU0601_MAG3]|nr:MAG: hypothetical protein RSE13_01480 [Planktothrix sp. GU0601_MAG3]
MWENFFYHASIYAGVPHCYHLRLSQASIGASGSGQGSVNVKT